MSPPVLLQAPEPAGHGPPPGPGLHLLEPPAIPSYLDSCRRTSRLSLSSTGGHSAACRGHEGPADPPMPSPPTLSGPLPSASRPRARSSPLAPSLLALLPEQVHIKPQSPHPSPQATAWLTVVRDSRVHWCRHMCVEINGDKPRLFTQSHVSPAAGTDGQARVGPSEWGRGLVPEWSCRLGKVAQEEPAPP